MTKLQVPIDDIVTVWTILVFIGIALITLNFGAFILYLFKKTHLLRRVLFISGIFIFLTAFVLLLMEDQLAETIAYIIITLGLLGIIVPLFIRPKKEI